MSIKVFKQDRKSLAIIIYVAHVRCEGFIHADVEGVLVLLFKPRSELVDQPVLRNLAADFTHSVISDNLNASCLVCLYLNLIQNTGERQLQQRRTKVVHNMEVVLEIWIPFDIFSSVSSTVSIIFAVFSFVVLTFLFQHAARVFVVAKK